MQLRRRPFVTLSTVTTLPCETAEALKLNRALVVDLQVIYDLRKAVLVEQH